MPQFDKLLRKCPKSFDQGCRSHRKKKRLHFKSLALLKQARLTSNDELLFLFLNVDIVPRNTIPGKLAYISKSKWVRIIAIKTE